jgi:small subunit ribosomal protein S6e
MADFKLVISDPKNKKAYQIEMKSPDSERLVGKVLGDKISGELINAHGFEFEITGGSDKEGFPMRKDIRGTKRVKAVLSGGTGFRPKSKGERRRKSVRGNQVSEDIIQINLKVTKEGPKPLGVVLGKEEKKEAAEVAKK